jgi:hypothetical protein
VCDCKPNEFCWDELRHVAYLDNNSSHEIKFKKITRNDILKHGSTTAEAKKGYGNHDEKL